MPPIPIVVTATFVVAGNGLIKLFEWGQFLYPSVTILLLIADGDGSIIDNISFPNLTIIPCFVCSNVCSFWAACVPTSGNGWPSTVSEPFIARLPEPSPIPFPFGEGNCTCPGSKKLPTVGTSLPI